MGWAAIIPAVASIAGSLITSNAMKKASAGGQSVSQQPLQTPEQAEARKMLLNYYKQYGGQYHPGEKYEGKLGEYRMTDLEAQGLGSFANLLQNSSTYQPQELYGMSHLKDLMEGDRFDPYNKKGEYGQFLQRLKYDEEQAKDELRRDLAAHGQYFSSGAANAYTDLAKHNELARQGKLSELYDKYTNRKIRAIPWALEASLNKQQLDAQGAQQNFQNQFQTAQASQTYGGLQRMLMDLQAKDMYADWKRQHEEKGQTLNSLNAVLGSSPGWGVKDFSIPGAYNPSPWADVLNKVTEFGMTWAQNPNMFSSGGSGSTGSGSTWSQNNKLNLDRWWQ